MTEHRWTGFKIGPFMSGRITPVDTANRRPRFFIGWIVVVLIASGSLLAGLALAVGLAIVQALYLIAEAVADTDDTENSR